MLDELSKDEHKQRAIEHIAETLGYEALQATITELTKALVSKRVDQVLAAGYYRFTARKKELEK